MIDTTLSSATANSYLSINEADRYFDGNPFFGTTWISIADPEKEFWLRHATRALDRMFIYKGYKAEKKQALQFPRRLQKQDPMRIHVEGHFAHYDEESSYFDPQVLHPLIGDAIIELIPLVHREKGSSETGTIEGREEESISILNGLAKIEYKDRKSSETLHTVSGGTVQSIRSLMRPWIRSAKIVR